MHNFLSRTTDDETTSIDILILFKKIKNKFSLFPYSYIKKAFLCRCKVQGVNILHYYYANINLLGQLPPHILISCYI